MRHDIGGARGFSQGHGCATESAASQARTENARHRPRDLDETIQVGRGIFEVRARAFMRSIHERPKLGGVRSGFQNLDGAQNAIVLSDDMSGAAKKYGVEVRAGTLKLRKSNFAEAAHAERVCRSGAFGAPLIVETLEQFMFATRLGDHHDEFGWK